MTDTYAFVKESNRIEGIDRAPSKPELDEHYRFMQLSNISLDDLQRFVSIYQPDARLRDQLGLNVRVGSHFPPLGGIMVRSNLLHIIDSAQRTPESAFRTHHLYETLHPFTDGNGRSGRMLWLWQMKEAPLGFLHHWYYQTLQHCRIRD